jgi:hypothetical protein
MTVLDETDASAPEPVMVKRWRCPFCRRTHSSRARAALHIARCWLNPAARACKTCQHYEYEPDGEPCFPSRSCDCNQGYERCGRGFDLGGTIRSSCALWELRKEDNHE